MKYEIIGQTVPAVEITLNSGETIVSQSGGMTWQTDGIQMSTNTNGGLMKGLGRMFAGESLFMNMYTALKQDSKITFASTLPGQIVPINLSNFPSGIIAQKGAFICSEKDVNLKITLSKKFSAGLFGGEGFILQELSGNGTAFLEVDGDMVEKNLAPGEILKVDTGNVVAFEKSVSYEIETVKGLSNIFFGGEGLFLTKLVGPGRVILQTQNFNDFAGRIISRIPSK